MITLVFGNEKVNSVIIIFVLFKTNSNKITGKVIPIPFSTTKPPSTNKTYRVEKLIKKALGGKRYRHEDV